MQLTALNATSPRFGTVLTLQSTNRRKDITETLNAQPDLFEKIVAQFRSDLTKQTHNAHTVVKSDAKNHTLETSVPPHDTLGKEDELEALASTGITLYNKNLNGPEAEQGLYWAIRGLALDMKKALTTK